MSHRNLFSLFIQPPFCTLRITIERYIIQKRWRFLFQLVSSKNSFQQHANSINYTSSGSWHAARVLIRLVGMPLEIYQIFTLLLRSTNFCQKFLAACQLVVLILQWHANCQQMYKFNNWHAAKNTVLSMSMSIFMFMFMSVSISVSISVSMSMFMSMSVSMFKFIFCANCRKNSKFGKLAYC